MLREKLAAVQHAIWMHWMKYMFTCGTFNPDGSWTMPAEKVDRWRRQMVTDFADLTLQEQKSDYEQADKVCMVLEQNLWAFMPQAGDSE